MKRIFFVCSIVALTFVGSFVNAQEGFRGPGPDVVTVDEAKSLRDDYPVVLRGRIERFLGDEKYLFTDETGSIIVEIDNRLWRGLSVDQNDTVEITGEVDRGFMRTEIEASSIKKV
ncbi:MAG: NirD/YgiW/YdeI family stress tolerance protein [Treponema sp.]|nr:NirD/YgiW/YdeI family stress tolerance protein [Treponema sp.]